MMIYIKEVFSLNNKVKRTFWLDYADDLWLKAMSNATGKSQGELVRLAIYDLYIKLFDTSKESGS